MSVLRGFYGCPDRGSVIVYLIYLFLVYIFISFPPVLEFGAVGRSLPNRVIRRMWRDKNNRKQPLQYAA